MPEEAADTVGQLRQLAHVSDGGALELRLAARRLLAGDRLLQVAVDTLVGVQLRAVAGQVEDLNLGLPPNQPGPDLGRAVNRQAVEDEEDLAAGIPDQAGEEAEQIRRLDWAVQHHPAAPRPGWSPPRSGRGWPAQIGRAHV